VTVEWEEVWVRFDNGTPFELDASCQQKDFANIQIFFHFHVIPNMPNTMLITVPTVSLVLHPPLPVVWLVAVGRVEVVNVAANVFEVVNVAADVFEVIYVAEGVGCV